MYLFMYYKVNLLSYVQMIVLKSCLWWFLSYTFGAFSLNMYNITEVSHRILIIKSYQREETNTLDIMGGGGEQVAQNKLY